jgi:hypothetical protein
MKTITKNTTLIQVINGKEMVYKPLEYNNNICWVTDLKNPELGYLDILPEDDESYLYINVDEGVIIKKIVAQNKENEINIPVINMNTFLDHKFNQFIGEVFNGKIDIVSVSNFKNLMLKAYKLDYNILNERQALDICSMAREKHPITGEYLYEFHEMLNKVTEVKNVYVDENFKIIKYE